MMQNPLENNAKCGRKYQQGECVNTQALPRQNVPMMEVTHMSFAKDIGQLAPNFKRNIRERATWVALHG